MPKKIPPVEPAKIQYYSLGEPQIISFVKKELSSVMKNDPAKIKEIMQQQVKKPDINSKEFKLLLFKKFLQYGDDLRDLFKYKGNDKKYIDKDILERLLKENKEAQKNLLFHPTLKWENPTAKNAVAKYAGIMLKNDQRRLEYYRGCLNNGAKTVEIGTLLSAPTPERSDANDAKLQDVFKKLKLMEASLNQTEGRFHSNSKEYEAMKKALTTFNKSLKERSVMREELGTMFENLQAASMNYVNAKGVGTQVTQRGIDRMDYALDICSLALTGMDDCISNERRQAVKDFEKEHLGGEITGGTLKVEAEKEKTSKSNLEDMLDILDADDFGFGFC